MVAAREVDCRATIKTVSPYCLMQECSRAAEYCLTGMLP